MGLSNTTKKEAGEKGRTRVENLSELVGAARDFEPDSFDELEESALKMFIDHALDAGETQAEHESADTTYDIAFCKRSRISSGFHNRI